MRPRKERRYNLILPLMTILLLMIVMVLYTTRLINSVAVTNIHEVGEDRIASVAAQLDNYLETTKSVLWVTADTVDHMTRNGSTTEQVLQYITEESQNQEQQFDENYTGLYGFIMGEYLDGVGWVPPEGYDPVDREWYRVAVEAGGESVIVPPYVDAQTHAVIISISRMLSNGRDVLSLDVTMNHIQDIIAQVQIKGKGYGYIIDETGMIIAHRDASQNGSSLTDTEEGRALLQNIRELGNGSFEMTLNGERSTVFVRRIMDQWTVVIVVSNAELYAEIRQQMVVNILICVVIFILIAFFYYRGYRNEQNYSRRMEEMKMEEQQQAYETKMLKMAKEASDQANQAKSDFLAEMSHEIRTPINAVLGMNEMVLRESARALDMTPTNNTADAFSHIHTYARDIESAGNSLLSIINDILDFSKIEAGRLEIEEHGYRLSAVLNDVTNMIFFRAKDKGLDFTVDVDKSVPDGLYGDHVRFRQVLTNLLNNAVKYTDHGRICLKVSREAGEVTVGKSVTLVMAVSDTGIGIREEDIGKLFTKFQRVDMKRNSTVEGTGLGLAITQSLVAMMGGEIRVESTYGKGSTFTVVLPQRVEVIEPIKDFQRRFESARSGSDAYRASFHAPNARILIVDDTRMNLVVAKGLLKDTEIGIDVAISGAEAIELAKSVWYDLILMDQRMPEMNGTEVMRLIQEQPDGLNKTTPVICVTADAVIGARERYLAQGFVDYLTKPIDSQKLEKLLVRYLPADKVVLQTLEAATKPQETSDDGFSYLYAAGIDPQIGLGYCQGNAALYQTLLKEYLDGSAKRLDDLDRYYDAGDWMNYGIVVHALKSGSRMIGAQALSERAAALEAAADRGDADAIRREHPQMMEDCRKLADALALHIDMSETNAEDGEVLEFMPE